MTRGRRNIIVITALLVAVAVTGTGRAQDDGTAALPAAVIDLATSEGVAQVKGQWRYHDARIVAVRFPAAGPEGQPTGDEATAHDLEPRAGGAGYDDSGWEAVGPEELSRRRGHGRLSFGWYRIRLTVPGRIGDFDPTGSTIVLDTSVDDYAEVWVDGELARALGQHGGSVIAGWNASNRLVIARDARPGRMIQLAVFGANGPLSDPPTNYVWMRHARLEFFSGDAPVAVPVSEVNVVIDRFDPRLDAIVSRNPKLHKLAEGFTFTEGPVWLPEGALLFSDPNANRIYRYDVPSGDLSVFRAQSGYAGRDLDRYAQPGSNGLAFDPQGRLTICEHGNRRITRLEADGSLTVLADRDGTARLNSPNDLVYRSDGSLYFTDPPFGLPEGHGDPDRELPYAGVYRRDPDGRVTLLASDLSGPNGLAFSPDERTLYVGNWDEGRKIVMRYHVAVGGSLAGGTVFCDLTAEPGDDAIDGVKVDATGNVFVSGPGGLWIFAADGERLALVRTPRHVHNMAWGDDDRRSLYLCARDRLYRMRLGVPGAGIGAAENGRAAIGSIERLDPRLDGLIPRDARIERIASGFAWLEGPVWSAVDSRLYFSDIPGNVVHRWQEPEGATSFLRSSGYSGPAPYTGREPGSNGLVIDAHGRLVLCEHGNRRITRLEPDGSRTVLADRFRGRRLNRPNDAVYASNGDLYFTDPPFGLPAGADDPGRELSFSGVYRLRPDGDLHLLIDDLGGPNGIALSPDERTLYVSNAVIGPERWLAYELTASGSVGPPRVLLERTSLPPSRPGTPDGFAVDRYGNLFTAGPGAIYVLAPDGTPLGTILTGVPTSNCAWGGDGSTLYITASDALYRVQTTTSGDTP